MPSHGRRPPGSQGLARGGRSRRRRRQGRASDPYAARRRSSPTQLMTTALSVASHIADGYARPSPLRAARILSSRQTRSASARDRRWPSRGRPSCVAASSFGDFAARGAQVARLLAGYLVYLDRQISDRESAASPATASATPGASTRDSVRAHARTARPDPPRGGARATSASCPRRAAPCSTDATTTRSRGRSATSRTS